MKALVLGATGHVGQGVIRELLAHDYRVTAATRQRDPPALANLSVELAVGDQYDEGLIHRWVAEHDVVVDAAAPRPLGFFAAGSESGPRAMARAQWRTDVLVDAVRRTGARLAFVSSFTTLPRPERLRWDAQSRCRRDANPYFAVKALMERGMLRAGQSGLPVVVVNPSAVMGPWFDRAPDASLVGLVLAQRLPCIMRHVVNVIDVRDVAAGIRAALEAERFAEPIPLSAHDVSLDDLARRIATVARVPAPPPMDPAWAGAAALWAEALWALAGQRAPNAVRVVALAAEGWPMGPSAPLGELGVRPRPLDVTLADSVAWLRGGRPAPAPIPSTPEV